MDKFFNIISSSKLPTLIVIGFLLWIGKELIINSHEQSLQSPSLIVGVILIWIATIIIAMVIPGFKDKEKMDFVFDRQERAIKSLSDTLNKINKTSMIREKQTQTDIKSEEFGKESEHGNKKYSTSEENQTQTS